MSLLVGRIDELKKLSDLYARKSLNLVVVKGRRRIGKSFLITQFAKQKEQFLSFKGLPPADGVTAQAQIDYFAHQMAIKFNLPPVITFHDWTAALNFLFHHIQDGAVVLFDEISWMGGKDPTFVPKLKAWWETSISQKKHVLLIFCGSVSTWIDDNIINFLKSMICRT